MNNHRAKGITTVPAWVKGANLFEAAALMDIEGKFVRMSADDQRALMGFAVFGKQEFCVNADGTVTIRRATCFGTDSESHTYYAGKIKAAAAVAKKLAPGVFGPAYL